MAVIADSIRVEHDNTISFGDYTAEIKKKIDGFEVEGDIYNVRTHNLVTRLEKNGKLLFESVPGSTIHNFKLTEKMLTFLAEGSEDIQVTVELVPDQEYRIFIDSVDIGHMKSNLSGKISFSLELGFNLPKVKIEKV